MHHNRKRRGLQELNLADDFLFSKVMADEEICRRILEKILNVKIRQIVLCQEQKSLNLNPESRGIRFDLYLLDDANTIYEVEMQNGREYHLPKRSRYYQGNMDLDHLTKGYRYRELPKSYVIFICTFDYFGAGRHIYTFENICLEGGSIRFGDDSHKIVLNTKGTLDDVDDEMLELLHYIEDSSEQVALSAKSNLVKQIHQKVTRIKENRELGVEFMTLEELMQDRLEEGHREGLEETARNMKKKGFLLCEIAELTGLSEEQVEQL